MGDPLEAAIDGARVWEPSGSPVGSGGRKLGGDRLKIALPRVAQGEA